LGTCSICGRQDVDTISGVCGDCIGRNRKRGRQRKNAVKAAIIVSICVAGIFGVQHFVGIETLQNLLQNTSQKVSTTAGQFEKQAVNFSESIKPRSIPETSVTFLNNTASQIRTFIPPVPVKPGSPTGQAPESTLQNTPSVSVLYQHALDVINKDRRANNLPPVQLDNNQAAQIHAEDNLKQRTLSHYMSTGEKPYMVYTRYSGTGYVAQNVASRMYDISQCQKPFVACPAIDPVQAIDESEDEMMNNDAASNWGHRDNILDKNHNYVSIGIAYDQYSFFLVQNFENKYIDSVNPVIYENGKVSISGNLIGKTIGSVGIAYDPLPTGTIYQMHKDDGFYLLDTTYAAVFKPAEGGMYYLPSQFSFIEADSWSQTGNNVNISFDLNSLISKAGVYTVVANTDDNVPLTSYSIVVSNPQVSQSSNVHYACTQTQLNQFDLLQNQYQTLAKQYDAMPRTATSESQYQQAMQMYNQLQSLETQMKNFRC
jgi:uncharacterized protein YkwD